MFLQWIQFYCCHMLHINVYTRARTHVFSCRGILWLLPPVLFHLHTFLLNWYLRSDPTAKEQQTDEKLSGVTAFIWMWWSLRSYWGEKNGQLICIIEDEDIRIWHNSPTRLTSVNRFWLPSVGIKHLYMPLSATVTLLILRDMSPRLRPSSESDVLLM